MAKNSKINRIAVIMKERKIKQKELADKLNLNTTTINNYCNNRKQPPLAVLRDIADALNVDIRDCLYPSLNRIES